MSRVDWKILSKSVFSDNPVLGVVEQIKTVETEHKTILDLKTWKIIIPDFKKVLLGRYLR